MRLQRSPPDPGGLWQSPSIPQPPIPREGLLPSSPKFILIQTDSVLYYHLFFTIYHIINVPCYPIPFTFFVSFFNSTCPSIPRFQSQMLFHHISLLHVISGIVPYPCSLSCFILFPRFLALVNKPFSCFLLIKFSSVAMLDSPVTNLLICSHES